MLAFLLIACKACDPGLPDPPKQDTAREDTGPVEESEPLDTSPPPACEQPEVEPNGTQANATDIEREELACGAFTAGLDLDFFAFETTSVGWYEIDVDAGEGGSAADTVLSLANLDEDLKLSVDKSATGTDPRVVIPLSEPDTWFLLLNEENAQGGDEGFEYEFRVSQTKEPATWDTVEDADHGTWQTAQELPLGTTVYGTLGESTERDWFVVHTPDYKTDVAIEVLAHRAGSPLDAQIQLFREVQDSDDASVVDTEPEDGLVDDAFASATAHPTEPGWDPAKIRSAEDETWYVRVRYEDGGTGPLYWYTITATEVTE